ncbi:hypothetical protein [Bacillus manliponensis]|uniref:hypothetical protein n=1 Tax=Bacillus manliponensis TaxID=574376 RepID=UPI0035127CF4
MERIEELEKRVMELERQLEEKQPEKVTIIQVFLEACASLLFGLFVVGPIIVIMYGIIIYFMSK